MTVRACLHKSPCTHAMKDGSRRHYAPPPHPGIAEHARWLLPTAGMQGIVHLLLPGWAATSLISRSTCGSSAARTNTFQATRAQSRHVHPFFRRRGGLQDLAHGCQCLPGRHQYATAILCCISNTHPAPTLSAGAAASRSERRREEPRKHPRTYSVKTEHMKPDIVRVALPRGVPRILDRHRPVGHEQPKLILAPDSRHARALQVTPGARLGCARSRTRHRAAAGQGGGARTIEGSRSNASLMAASTRGPSNRVSPSSRSATSGWFIGMPLSHSRPSRSRARDE